MLKVKELDVSITIEIRLMDSKKWIMHILEFPPELAYQLHYAYPIPSHGIDRGNAHTMPSIR